MIEIPRGTFRVLTSADFNYTPQNNVVQYTWSFAQNGVVVSDHLVPNLSTVEPLFYLVWVNDSPLIYVGTEAVSGVYTFVAKNGYIAISGKINVLNRGVEGAPIERINPGETKTVSLPTSRNGYSSRLGDFSNGGWALSILSLPTSTDFIVQSKTGTQGVNGFSVIESSTTPNAYSVTIPNNYSGPRIVEVIYKKSANEVRTGLISLSNYESPLYNQQCSSFEVNSSNPRFTGNYTGSEAPQGPVATSNNDWWEIRNSLNNVIAQKGSGWNLYSSLNQTPTYDITIPQGTSPGRYYVKYSALISGQTEPYYYSGCFNVIGQVDPEDEGLPVPNLRETTLTTAKFLAPSADSFPVNISILYLLIRPLGDASWQNRGQVTRSTPEQELTLNGLASCLDYEAKWSKSPNENS